MPASPRWCPNCRRSGPTRSDLCSWSARWPISSKINSRVFSRLGVARCTSFPRGAPRSCHRSVRARPAGAAVPGETARALEDRGARRLAAPFPLGVEGTTLWLKAAAMPGMCPRRDSSASRRPRERARRRLRHRDELAGKRIFFFPEFAARSAAGTLPVARTGHAARRGRQPLSASAASRARTGDAAGRHMLSEGQDVERQLDRCRPPSPTSWCAAWVSPIRWKPKASPPNGRSNCCSRRCRVTSRPAISPNCLRARSCVAPGWWPDMQLTLWTYEAPPHVGAMRIATAMDGTSLCPARAAGRHLRRPALHHDRAADSKRPPVTYTTFQARDLGGDTAELFKRAAKDAYERFQPQAMIVGASCTAELIQDDPGGLAQALALPVPVIPLELPAYQKKENWGAAETFYQIVRRLAGPHAPAAGIRAGRARGWAAPSCNLLGATALGFRHRDDVQEIAAARATRHRDACLRPLGATPADHRKAWRRRLQCRAVSGNRRPDRAMAAAELRSAFHQDHPDRRRRHARLHRRSGASLPGSMLSAVLAARAPGCPGIRNRSTRPISPASASSSSATPRT